MINMAQQENCTQNVAVCLTFSMGGYYRQVYNGLSLLISYSQAKHKKVKYGQVRICQLQKIQFGKEENKYIYCKVY